MDCRHCGEPGERATTTDRRSIQADACYGCRNRHTTARQLLDHAAADIRQARTLLEMVEEDTDAIEAADALARVELELNTTRKGLSK